MLIAIDYDGTYTADPEMWEAFARYAKMRGHEVHLVTMRHPSESVRIGQHITTVHYTDRKGKREYMLARELHVGIWIDDMPDFIVTDAAPRDLEENAVSGLWAKNARL
jgi:Glycosyl transferase 4-like